MLLAAYMMYLLFGSFGNAILVAEGSQLHPCSISYPIGSMYAISHMLHVWNIYQHLPHK